MILVFISHFKISIFWSKLQNPHYLGPEVDDVDEEGDHHCSDHRSKICHSWINLADDNAEKRLLITLAICSKCSKIYLIPFAELSILDVVFALRIPCLCVLWWKKGFGKHNRSLPRFSSPGLENLVQGEGREERNDGGGDSDPDKPGTSVRVFCCASSMFSLSLFHCAADPSPGEILRLGAEEDGEGRCSDVFAAVQNFHRHLREQKILSRASWSQSGRSPMSP